MTIAPMAGSLNRALRFLARNGIVTTSQPLAAQAGLQILKNGGNDFDAVVATAAVLNASCTASNM